MTAESDLARMLTEAQRAGTASVDQALLSGLDRAGAYRVQRATMAALGASAGMYKIAIAADGAGIAAPIYGERVGDSGRLRLPAQSISGLEVEIGVVLAHDLPPGSDRAAVEAAVGRYFVGIEICGTRYLDRTAATPEAGLADNLSAFGYAIDPADWARGTDIDGLDVVLRLADAEIHRAPARHGFGGVLEAVVAYAGMAEQPYPLVSGTILTTGSMCGLVPVTGTGTAVAEFGGHAVTVELA